MEITLQKIKSPYNARWAWPLKLGLVHRNPSLIKKLLSGFWSKSFVKIVEIDDKAHNNIILFESYKSFHQYNPYSASTADVLLILLKPGEKTPLDLDAKALELLRSLKAMGIFIFPAGDIGLWFSQFIVELSHDRNIVEAIQKTRSEGSGWYDPKLETQTSLSFITNKVIQIFKANSNVKFKVDSKLTNKISMSGNQIAKLIRKNLTSFDSESHSATHLHEILRSALVTKPDNFRTMALDKNSGYVLNQSDPKKHSIRNENLIKTQTGEIQFKHKKEVEGSGPIRSIAAKKAAPKKALKKAPKKTAKAKKPFSAKAKPPGGSDAVENEKPQEPKLKSTDLDHKARYLQASIQSTKGKPVKDYFSLSTQYNIHVLIGYKKKEFLDTGEKIDTKAIFKNSIKAKEPIQIKFITNLDKKINLKTISLPRKGDSTHAIFSIKTDSEQGKFKGEIYAYYKNRLIQHVRLTADIGKNLKGKSAVRILQVFSAKKNLDNINKVTPFTTSIIYKTDTKTSSITGINKNKAVDLVSENCKKKPISKNGKKKTVVENRMNKGKEVEIFLENGLKDHLDDMKNAIENALLDPKEKNYARLIAKGNQELFLYLARKGNLIYTDFLRGSIAPDGPLQIITNYQEYAPLEFIYNFAAPADDATLCPNAEAALKEGACKNCFDLKKEPAPHICPFGFWSFSRVLERHSVRLKENNSRSDYTVVSEPTETRNQLNVLQKSIYASAEKVEVTATKGLRKQIALFIKKNSKLLFEANDWKNWTAEMEENKPDTLFLIVHIEKDKFNINNIQIGNNFLSQNFFKSQLIANEELAPPPFIVIIGCEAINLKASGFDVSSQLMNSGAAIVLSNFTKIRGRQAKAIIFKLIEFLKQDGKEETLLGEVMLKLRQFLLSEGLVAGLSLVAQGDADWKIKT